MMRVVFAVVLLTAATARAAVAPAAIARLVASSDDVSPRLAEALHAPDPLARATAARVAAVRSEVAVLPAVREVLASEANADAAREEIRALILLGSDDDVDLAITA